MTDVNLFFTSESARLIFVALHTDGKVRNDFLALPEKAYHDRDAAELWRIETINAIKKDGGFDEATVQLAIDVVNELYEGCVFDGYDEPDEKDFVEKDGVKVYRF